MERQTSDSKREFEWYKRFPRRYIDATRRLSPKARFVYSELIDQMMMLDRELPNDIGWLACQMHAKPRYVREGLDELIAAGKIERTPHGTLANHKCAENITKRRHQSAVNSQTAADRERVRRESLKGRRQVGDEYAEHSEPDRDVNQGQCSNKINVTGGILCNETSTTRTREDSDLDSDKEIRTDRGSSRPRAPTAAASLFEPDECGNPLVENGTGFKWADPQSGEPRKISYDWCANELPDEKLELVREFVKGELLAALDQGKSGSLVGWVRHGINKRFPKWRLQREAARRSLREAEELREPPYQGPLEPAPWFD